MRCLRCAGAPRRPASSSELSLHIPSWHAVLSDPGESNIDMFQNFDADMAFAVCPPARHSQNSRNPFHAGFSFRGFTGSLPLRPARLLAPLYGSDWDRPAFGDFYFQAFNRSVSLSVAGYNYNNGWISLCWRDLHPLEWQLVSLHGQTEKNSVRVYVFRFEPQTRTLLDAFELRSMEERHTDSKPLRAGVDLGQPSPIGGAGRTVGVALSDTGPGSLGQSSLIHSASGLTSGGSA